MTEQTQTEINIQAQNKVMITYPYRNLATAFRESGKYGEIISYLRLLGLRCVSCKGNVTEPNLALVGYDVTKVKCKKCQTNKQ